MSTVWLEMLKRQSNGTKPQRRDPAATRRKLLVAARREFADSGLAGARVDEIAARAGVNKQLVYHYFGDKDALYLAVLEWVYEEIREHERKLNLEGLPPERAIRKLIESSFDHLAAHPDFIVLLNDENRGGARHVRGSRKLEAMHSPLVSMVSNILREGVQVRNVPARHRSGASLYLDRGLELFLLLQHTDAVGDLRQGSRQSRCAQGSSQARGRSGDAGVAAVRKARHCRGAPSLRGALATSNPSIVRAVLWIASSRSLSPGAHSRDPLAPRNDGWSHLRGSINQLVETTDGRR